MEWYSKEVKLKREDGIVEGKDSDLKVMDSVCKYYDIPSIIGFNMIGVPYVNGYDDGQTYTSQNKFRRHYRIDLYQVYKKPMIRALITTELYNRAFDEAGQKFAESQYFTESMLLAKIYSKFINHKISDFSISY